MQLSLEPNANPAGKAFQQAMFAQSIPLAAFEVNDIKGEYDRLRALGVVFTRVPSSRLPSLSLRVKGYFEPAPMLSVVGT